jgi:Sap, sulfolipid-1-addressing protein
MLSPTTLTFSVLALVLSKRPGRTGLWFFSGAFGLRLLIGVVAAFVLGNSAASSGKSSEPPTWVAVFDVVAGALLAVYVVHALRRPRDPKRTVDAIDRMSKISSSPAIAIVGAGATLANPGGFIPIALKDISQTETKHRGIHRALGRLRARVVAPAPRRASRATRLARLDRFKARSFTRLAGTAREGAGCGDHPAARRGAPARRDRRAHDLERVVWLAVS